MINIRNKYKLSAAFIFVMLIMFTSFSVWASPSHSKPPAEISLATPIPTQVLGISISGHDSASPDKAQPINVSSATTQTIGAPLCSTMPVDGSSYSQNLCGSPSTGLPHTDRPYTNIAPGNGEISIDPGVAQTTGAPLCSAMPTNGTSDLRGLCGGNCLAACMNPL